MQSPSCAELYGLGLFGSLPQDATTAPLCHPVARRSGALPTIASVSILHWDAMTCFALAGVLVGHLAASGCTGAYGVYFCAPRAGSD